MYLHRIWTQVCFVDCRYLVLLSKWGYLGVKCPSVCFCGELLAFPFQRWKACLVNTRWLLNCLTFGTLLYENVMWRLGQWLWFSDESASAGGEQPRNVRKGSPSKGSEKKLGLSTHLHWWGAPPKVSTHKSKTIDNHQKLWLDCWVLIHFEESSE